MIDLETAREICLSFPEAYEQDHFERPSFRVNKKIFATLWLDEKRVVVKLSTDEQLQFCDRDPEIFSPVKGGWGKQGWTTIHLDHINKIDILKQALAASWSNVASKKLQEKFKKKMK